jgi:hypothetical protein
MGTTKWIGITLLIVSKIVLQAQDNIPGVLNPPTNPCGNYYKENIGNRKPIPYTPLREEKTYLERH